MINGLLYRDMIISAANLLESKKEDVNRLNVFPVPDGDTGTNMSLTMGAGKRDMADFSGNLSECSARVAASLLRGGRGNSGVILSLFFRGVSRSLSGKEETDPEGLAAAFAAGVDAAYKAVRHPTEGTVLTVMRVMAETAASLAPGFMGTDGEFFGKLTENCYDTLSHTPELLPALRQANVVDAGGMGFSIIMEGMTKVAKGEGVVAASSRSTAATASSAEFGSLDTGDIRFGYCTECIVDKNSECNEEKVNAINSFINGVGDSVVFVDDESFIKFHVHTNDPGRVLTEALKIGSLSMVKVENMRNQHSELVFREEEKKKPEILPPEKNYGFVAVAAGNGLRTVFCDLGADRIVEGGQTMNPSTEDIVNAVLMTPAENVFVLPNNKNIYMAAVQAVEIVTDRKVLVLPSYTVPQGISAMLAFDGDTSPEENTDAMTAAMSGVITGKMTFAARDSVVGDLNIRQGQILGMIEGDVRYVCDSREECLTLMAEALKEKEFITLFYGSDVSEEEAENAADVLRSALGENAEVTVVDGGQPVYYYLISAENG